jgi:hypothetical protein
MKCRSVSVAALGVVLTCGTHLARPAEIAIHVPDTAAAHSARDLISRAGRALRRYLEACDSTTAREPREIVTSDARIEFALNTEGASLTLDANAVFAGCIAVGELWIYPTGDKNAVFVQYDMPTRQIAVIEMRGERIQRMRNFGAAPAALLEAMRGTAQSELCTRLSRLGGVLVMTETSR